jgi:hypothetical protein
MEQLRALWDSEDIARPTAMPASTSPLRLLSVASRVTLLWLMSAASAHAALPGLCAARAGQAAAAVKLSTAPAHTTKPARPLRKVRCRPRLSANDLVPRAGRAIVHRPGAAAIVQNNEAPAAHGTSGDALAPSFCSFGVISGGGDVPPSSRPFSPQSPRGPPLTA